MSEDNFFDQVISRVTALRALADVMLARSLSPEEWQQVRSQVHGNIDDDTTLTDQQKKIAKEWVS